jgi:hypothetical protein
MSLGILGVWYNVPVQLSFRVAINYANLVMIP